MKLLDKLKNALFEEEYVEVEDKKEVKKKEKPIAKKVIIDDPKPKKEAKKDEIIIEEEKSTQGPNIDFKFKAILEDDFIDLEPRKEEVKNHQTAKENLKEEPKEDCILYNKDKEIDSPSSKPYGIKKDQDLKFHEYGSYEKKQEKKEFHPSPIISPIYGVLDQNYKKEEIVTKKEVRITSSYKSRNIDVDSVRQKAYGNSDDIFDEELTSNKKVVAEDSEEPEDIKEEDSLLDISADNTPSVPKVTMGDAEEYFKDLGLEYNIDYKDASHERATGRRTDLRSFDEDLNNQKETVNLEDNLFDLIDSMYDEKKGE